MAGQSRDLRKGIARRLTEHHAADLTLSLELEVRSFEFEGDLLGRVKSEFSDTDTFIKDEIGELFGLAEALCARAHNYQALFHQLIA